ncbi:GNAT family N-acetyltransferase [Trinickia dinghuensis]|uniref:GNAT family N-acetyltransferase n=1 Tax=Trinickia dinghuensis TaxID=2291023 RepID=A0A3D8JY11_9BURK|nr:GNAT family N-acetyltransferase [Trinickia dinghuensis]RDU97524.1 GNAT family N-acetyltransferase [Trinickia dinghuensis]
MRRQLQENLGLATDLLLHAEIGSVSHDDRYVVMRTAQAPDYFSGNMLVLDGRPAQDDRQRLEDDFARLVGLPPSIAHRSFAWPENEGEAGTEGAAGALDSYAARGYEATMFSVLVAESNAIHCAQINESIDVRLFEFDRDWDDWARISLANMPDPESEVSQRCVEFQRSAYRSLIERQRGNWWGAFLDGELVGSLGLFFFGSIGRFQSIVTREDQRNKRVCRTLLSEVIKRAAGARDRLVIVADESYHAIRLYETLGFVRQGRIGSLCQAPS